MATKSEAEADEPPSQTVRKRVHEKVSRQTEMIVY